MGHRRRARTSHWRSTKPVLGNWVASETVVAALEEEVRSLVEQAGPLGLDVALLDERQRLAINNLQEVEVSDGRVKSIDQEDILVDHPILNELEKDLFSLQSASSVIQRRTARLAATWSGCSERRCFLCCISNRPSVDTCRSTVAR